MVKYLILISFALASCATTGQNKDPFPPENYVVMCPYTGFPTVIPEGFFDNPDNWMTEKAFDNLPNKIQADKL